MKNQRIRKYVVGDALKEEAMRTDYGNFGRYTQSQCYNYIDPKHHTAYDGTLVFPKQSTTRNVWASLNNN